MKIEIKLKHKFRIEVFLEGTLVAVGINTPVPIDELQKIMKYAAKKEWVLLNSGIARRLGTGMLMGTKSCIQDLVAHAPDLYAPDEWQLSLDAQLWYSRGEQGMSSRAMFSKILGVPMVDEFPTPQDSGDFGRCLALYLAVPEIQANLSKMKEVSPAWDYVISIWDELAELQKNEKFKEVSEKLKLAIYKK